jgi:hypothetical protein
LLAFLRSHWKLLVTFTVIAAVGIQLFDPDYNNLQTATGAVEFRHVLDSSGQAIGATLCDIAFAVGYGALGLVALRALGAQGAAAKIGALLIILSAGFDELENLLLLGNIVRSSTLTDASIDVMRVPGTLKWIGSPVFLILLVGLAVRAVRRPTADDRSA